MRPELTLHFQVPVVAHAVHRAGRGNRRRSRPHVHRSSDGSRGRRTTATVTAAAGHEAGAGQEAGAGSSGASGRAGRQRGPTPAPALLPGSRMGLGGGGLRVHGALAQSRAAAVVRRPGEGRGQQVSGRHLRRHR